GFRRVRAGAQGALAGMGQASKERSARFHVKIESGTEVASRSTDMAQCDAAGVNGSNRILSHGAPPGRLMPNGCLGSPAIVLLRTSQKLPHGCRSDARRTLRLARACRSDRRAKSSGPRNTF